MTPMEIALLIIGVILFAASFIIPEMRDKTPAAEGTVPEEEVKKAVREEIGVYENKIGEVVDETVHYAVEKTERSLDKLSNEKIMAVSEYSQTVLSEIDKNHKEIMFLYDMLTEKEETLKNTVQAAERTAKAARQTVEVIDEKTRNAKETAEVVEGTLSTVRAAVTRGVGESAAAVEAEDMEAFVGGIAGRELGDLEKARILEPLGAGAAGGASDGPETAGRTGGELTPDSGGDAGKNSNEHILNLHQQGKSKMAIAKELGLGLGEVQLVIDLFEGAKG